jgi:hypothetical protein
VCEVCNEPVFDNSQFPKEIQDQIYRPGDGESYNVEVTIDRPALVRADQVEPTDDGQIKIDLDSISDEPTQ